MIPDTLTTDDALAKIEKWFSETYRESGKSPEEVQLLILYKLHQLEERLKTVEYRQKRIGLIKGRSADVAGYKPGRNQETIQK